MWITNVRISKKAITKLKDYVKDKIAFKMKLINLMNSNIARMCMVYYLEQRENESFFN